MNITLLFIIYFISCLWIRIGSESKTSKNISQASSDEDLNYGSTFKTTVTSIYFYIATLTTCGFGDVFPTLMEEKILIIVLEFFGIGLFSYVLSQIMYSVHNYATSYSCKINEKREALRTWIQKRDLARNNYEKDFKPGAKIENYFIFDWRFNYKKMIDKSHFHHKMTSQTQINAIEQLFSNFFEDFSSFFNFINDPKAKVDVLRKLHPIL